MPDPVYPVTMTAASLLALLLLLLAFQCVKARFREVKNEDAAKGGALEAAKDNAVRVMANFTEYVPLGLLLILGLETSGFSLWVAGGFAAALVIARGLHAWGLSRNTGKSFGRFYGTLLTWLTIAGAAFANLAAVALSL